MTLDPTWLTSLNLPAAGKVVPVRNLDDAGRALRSEGANVLILVEQDDDGEAELDGPGIVAPMEGLLGGRIGPGELLLAGGCRLWGFDVAANILARGDGTQVWRCRLHPDSGAFLSASAGSGLALCRNELLGSHDQWGVRISARAAGGMLRPYIAYNHWHDWEGARHNNGTEPLQLGLTKNGQTDTDLGALVEHNLIETGVTDPEAISIKSSGNTVRFNTLLNYDGAITNRHGRGNRILANWLQACKGIELHDQGGECSHNGGGEARIRAAWGDCDPDEFRRSDRRVPCARGWTLEGNSLPIGEKRVGGNDVRPSGIAVGPAGPGAPAAYKATRAMVGPRSVAVH